MNGQTVEKVKVPEPEPTFCDKCGKDCVYEVGGHKSAIIGHSYEVRCKLPEWEEPMKHQLGKYEANRKYNFCWECVLDAFMRNKEDQ